MPSIIKETRTYEATPDELHSALGLPSGWIVKGISSIGGKYHIRLEKI